MNKFKEGDKARVKKATLFHGFAIGEIVTIKGTAGDHSVKVTGPINPRVVLERTKKFLGKKAAEFTLSAFKDCGVDLDGQIYEDQILLLTDLEPVDSISIEDII
jgi:hypothetical protein